MHIYLTCGEPNGSGERGRDGEYYSSEREMARLKKREDLWSLVRLLFDWLLTVGHGVVKVTEQLDEIIHLLQCACACTCTCVLSVYSAFSRRKKCFEISYYRLGNSRL